MQKWCVLILAGVCCVAMSTAQAQVSAAGEMIGKAMHVALKFNDGNISAGMVGGTTFAVAKLATKKAISLSKVSVNVSAPSMPTASEVGGQAMGRSMRMAANQTSQDGGVENTTAEGDSVGDIIEAAMAE